ncbi:MAG: lipid II:glycine glycyltransferase FemX, partial [Spirochaetaceae bacterium]
ESQGEEKNMPKLFMVTAEHGGDLLAGIIVSLYGDTATYMYGAGSNYKRNLMGSYAVQWEAIRLAKRLGVSFYDFFGIPPADDPSHPMYGLYRFKTGFGGRIIHRIGSMDYPISPSGYFFYRKAEKLRWFYYKKLKKR